MKSTFVQFAILIFLYAATLGTLAGPADSADPQAESKSESDSGEQAPHRLHDFQIKLLETAFEVASDIPVKPHIKSRSLAQRRVVQTLIELENPDMAIRSAEQIKNWHRGAAHAEVAAFLAERGDREAALEQLAQAEKIARAIDTWHKDRILAHMAQALEYVKAPSAMKNLTEGIAEHEAAKIHHVRSRLTKPERYAEQMASLNELLSETDFDVKRQALLGASALFDTFYADPERRDEIEENIRNAAEELPATLKIELFLQLADAALHHNDTAGAVKIVHECRKLFENAAWRPRFGIPVLARIAGTAHRAGDEKTAKSLIEQAKTEYQRKGEEIVNIYRAETLIPVAEAARLSEGENAARAIYRQAMEAAFLNPNSRPRAEDLSAVCLSMAKTGVKPTKSMWRRLDKLQAQLGNPW
ncbi:MAG: hypothetical protein ACOCUY_02490 [Verrucomicrobiota bacterium]